MQNPLQNLQMNPLGRELLEDLVTKHHGIWDPRREVFEFPLGIQAGPFTDEPDEDDEDLSVCCVLLPINSETCVQDLLNVHALASAWNRSCKSRDLTR